MCGRCVLSLMGRHNAALNLLHIHQKRNAVCMKLLCSMLVRVDTDLSYRTYSIGSECNGGARSVAAEVIWEELRCKSARPSI